MSDTGIVINVDMGPAQVELIPVQDEISKHEPIAEEPITA